MDWSTIHSRRPSGQAGRSRGLSSLIPPRSNVDTRGAKSLQERMAGTLRSQRSESVEDGDHGSFSVLAVTSHRPAEITNSVAGLGEETATLVLDSSRGTRLSRAVRHYHDIDLAIRTREPDLILLDCYEIPGAIVAALASRYDVALVARLVGDTWRGYESTTLRPVRSLGDVRRFVEHQGSFHLNSAVFAQADGFVAVSSDLQDIIHQRTGCPRDRIGVVPVPMTVDTDEAGSPSQQRQSLGIDEQQVVLTVTNLDFEEKFDGVRSVLGELQPVLEATPDLAYVVAGDGCWYDDLRQAVAETIDDPSVRQRIYTPGYVEDVSALYALADVFAYVSYRDGYPNAVLEAQTAGLPVVANDAHGMRDQITDGETGYLIEPTESGQLRSRIESLLGSAQRRDRIGSQARQRVLTENTPAVVSRQLTVFLGEFLQIHRQN